MAILKQLNEQGHTVIIVTHDPLIVAQAERIIEIKDGEIINDNCHQITVNKVKKRQQLFYHLLISGKYSGVLHKH